MLDLWYKIAPGIVGAAFVLGFGWLGLDAWRDYHSFGDRPLSCDPTQAADASRAGRQWVTLEGAPWRCDLMPAGVPGGVAFVPAFVKEGPAIVARFDHAIDCPKVVAAPLTGIIEPMDAGRSRDLRAAGLALPDDATRLRTLDVCSFCGRDNARLGVVICSLLVLLGLTLYPVRRAIVGRWSRARGALNEAIHATGGEAGARANRAVRTWGAATLALCAVAGVVAKSYVVYGFIPVRAVAVVGAVLGIWMVVSPESYRRLSSRAKR